MREHIRAGADPNGTGEQCGSLFEPHSTGLMLAAVRGHAECCQALIQGGAEAKLSVHGKTALSEVTPSIVIAPLIQYKGQRNPKL